MEDNRQRLWCHTCNTVFRAQIDNNFDYKCSCGSEFIEEITDRNDPRLFSQNQGNTYDTPQRPPPQFENIVRRA